jgi:ribosomal protein S18 acetylase RimI-like enzyme
MHPAPVVRRAERADLGQVADVLADAFATDPVLSWLLPPTVRNQRRRLRRLWLTVAKSYLQHDKPVYLTEDGMGAAVWAPPGRWASTTPEVLSQLVPYLRIFGTSIGRASQFSTTILGKHPKTPPHWYLYAIGAHTSAQGRGVGSALLRDRLDELDQRDEPAYLESSNIRNVPLYQRHGFEVVEEITIADGGPTLWRMWREPGA